MSNQAAAENQETWDDLVSFYEDASMFGQRWQSLTLLYHDEAPGFEIAYWSDTMGRY